MLLAVFERGLRMQDKRQAQSKSIPQGIYGEFGGESQEFGVGSAGVEGFTG